MSGHNVTHGTLGRGLLLYLAKILLSMSISHMGSSHWDGGFFFIWQNVNVNVTHGMGVLLYLAKIFILNDDSVVAFFVVFTV